MNSTLERQYNASTRQPSRRMRPRRRNHRPVFILIAVILLGFGALSFAFQPQQQHTWLKIPHDFYRPELISTPQVLSQQAMAPVPLGREDLALKAKIESVLGQFSKNLKPHLFYVNLQNANYVAIDSDTPVSAASVIKLPVLLTYFRRVDEGKLTPYTHLMYEDYEQAAGSGMLQYKTPGQPMLAKDVAQTMIQSSDNTCTNMLVYALGGSAQLDRQFQALGLRGTAIENWLPDLSGTNVISMRDMATVLFNIQRPGYLSDRSRQDALSILEGTHNRHLLPALLPKGTLIAHKTGDIGTALGNSGLIMLPTGQNYIVSMQVERPYNDYSARDMIQKVSKIIYDDVISKPVATTAHL